MENFKLEHFRTAHPGIRFPPYRSLTSDETADLRSSLARRLGLSNSADGLSVVTRLNDVGRSRELANALSDSFDLGAVIEDIGLSPMKLVFINWYRLDDVDEMNIDDLVTYLDDIWYPGSDDVDIFDRTCAWVISISHEGIVQFVEPKELSCGN